MTRPGGIGRLLLVAVLTVVATSCLPSTGPGADARTALLATKCAGGDFGACDDLAVDPDATVDQRTFGATCGGQRPAPAGSCSDLLGTTTSARGAPGASAGCLSRGARGDKVRELQQRLNAAGANPPLEVDGRFGPRTGAALEDLVGGSVLCAAEDGRLNALLAGYVDVPDVRRVGEDEARAALVAHHLAALSSRRCSDTVYSGAVITVQYERRHDRALLVAYDAEVPVNSQTTLSPPGQVIQLVISDGPCAGRTTGEPTTTAGATSG